MSSSPNLPPNGYNDDGFADSSVLYAKNFRAMHANAQVILDKESRQKRYNTEDYDNRHNRDWGEWTNDLSLKGELKNIHMHMDFL